MNPEIQTIVAELHRHFEAIYGDRLVRMILFGSQARGDAEPGSDIDIMVVLRELASPGREISRTGEITAELSLRYDVVISCTFISADCYAMEQSPLLLNVRREGVSV
ncbi:MAG: nucleotidyltransferase domain-containing protein [bacterium]